MEVPPAKRGLAPTILLLTNLLARQLQCRHPLPRSRTFTCAKRSNKLCERCSLGLLKPSALWFGSALSIAIKKRHSRGLLGNLSDGNKEGIFDNGWTVVKKKKKLKSFSALSQRFREFLMALFGLRFVNQGQNRPLV